MLQEGTRPLLDYTFAADTWKERCNQHIKFILIVRAPTISPSHMHATAVMDEDCVALCSDSQLDKHGFGSLPFSNQMRPAKAPAPPWVVSFLIQSITLSQ